MSIGMHQEQGLILMPHRPYIMCTGGNLDIIGETNYSL